MTALQNIRPSNPTQPFLSDASSGAKAPAEAFFAALAPFLQAPAPLQPVEEPPAPAMPTADEPESEGTEHADEDEAPSEPELAQPSSTPSVCAAPALAATIPLTIHSLNQSLLQRPGLPRASEASNNAPRANGPAADQRPERDAARSTTATDADQRASSRPAAPLGGPSAPPPVTSASVVADGAIQSTSTPRPVDPSRAAPSATPAVGAVTSASPTVSAGAVTAARLVAPTSSRDAGTARTGPAPVAAGAAQGPRVPLGALRIRSATPAQPGASRAELFQAQITRGLAAAVQKGQGDVTIHLKPEALGRVDIKMSMKEGVLTARFETQNSEARDLLLSTSTDLRRSLEAAGVTVERIETIVSPTPLSDHALQTSTNPDGAPPDRSDHRQHHPEQRKQPHPHAPSTSHAPESAAEPQDSHLTLLELGLDTIA